MNLFVKIEAFNPLGSVKDRLALGVIEAAEKSGELKPGQTVIEATSGNTGIGLAMVCAAKGYPLVVTMAETFSVERRKLMRFLGAKVVLTPAANRGLGMVNKANELAAKNGWFLTRQFENEANPDMHSRTTAREIVNDFKGEKLDYWVTGFGTGGTLKGVARVLAKEMPDTKIVVCEPADAPMLSSGTAQERKPDGSPAAPNAAFKPHPMQGWSPDFIPKLTGDAVDMKVIDRILTIAGPDAMKCSKDLARREGIFVGITAGATLRRRAAGRGGCAEGRQHPVHAARHRRALSLDAAVRRHPGRHDRRGAGDFPLHAGISDAAAGRLTVAQPDRRGLARLAEGNAATRVGRCSNAYLLNTRKIRSHGVTVRASPACYGAWRADQSPYASILRSPHVSVAACLNIGRSASRRQLLRRRAWLRGLLTIEVGLGPGADDRGDNSGA